MMMINVTSSFVHYFYFVTMVMVMMMALETSQSFCPSVVVLSHQSPHLSSSATVATTTAKRCTKQPQRARGASIVPYTTATPTTALTMVFRRGRNNDDNGKPTKELFPGKKKMTASRRKKLGINDDEDEYDLEMALDNNTDPLITKIIAGSLIVSILTLLIYGIVIPATTVYGDGVCNPLLTSGRC